MRKLVAHHRGQGERHVEGGGAHEPRGQRGPRAVGHSRHPAPRDLHPVAERERRLGPPARCWRERRLQARTTESVRHHVQGKACAVAERPLTQNSGQSLHRGHVLSARGSMLERGFPCHAGSEPPSKSRRRRSFWLDAGRISSEEKMHGRGVGIIDCAILAAARSSGARIWTLDRKLSGMLADSEKFVPKNSTAS